MFRAGALAGPPVNNWEKGADETTEPVDTSFGHRKPGGCAGDAQLSWRGTCHRRDPALVGEARCTRPAACTRLERLLRCHDGGVAQLLECPERRRTPGV